MKKLFVFLLVVVMGYAQENIGIVLMHGKDSTPKIVSVLSDNLESAGFKVLTPDMPWSKKRIYDRTYKESIEEINQYVKELKSDGMDKVYVAGHSMGAVVSAGYASLHDGIDGIILIAPGHFVSQEDVVNSMQEAVAKAKEMIDTGKADEKSDFDDINMLKKFTRNVKASVFYSWFNPEGEADFATNMKNLKADIPVLYVAASKDNIPRTKDRTYAYDNTPKNEKSKFIIIEATHMQVVAKSSKVVIEWLGGEVNKSKKSSYSQSQINRAGKVLNKFDSNGDNQLSPDEGPGKMRNNFDRLDSDSNGYLSEEELYNLPPR
jgi:esterase/lipase